MDTGHKYVYAIQFDNCVKIGYTKDLPRRMKELERINKQPCTDFDFICGDRYTEGALLLKLQKFLINGEYFNCSLKHIRACMKQIAQCNENNRQAIIDMYHQYNSKTIVFR